MTNLSASTTRDWGSKQRLKKWVFRRFLQNSQWRRRRDFLPLSVAQSGRKRRPENLDRRWLNSKYIHCGPKKVSHYQNIKKSYSIVLKPVNEIRFIRQIKVW